MDKRPFTVLVEGNIGSGKTTFLQQFQDLKDVALVEEPVSKWQNCGGNNLMALMYSDPARWSMTFQSYVQLTMLENHLLLPSSTSSIKLMERSIFSARYIKPRSSLDSKEAFVSDTASWRTFTEAV